MLAVLLFAAAASTDPLVTFKDWTAGCDNGRTCRAVGQYNPDNFELASVVLDRGPLRGDQPSFWFRDDGEPVVDLAADGRKLGVRLTKNDEEVTFNVAPESMPAVIAALRSATKLMTVRSDGKPGTQLSIAGASAAMRWIDDQQRRAGTVTALVATGPKPASAVPAPPPLPTVRQAIGVGPLGKPLTKAQIKAIQEEYADCSDDDLDDKVEYARIDARTTLAIVIAVCGSGAYNYYSMPMLLRAGRKPVLADLGEEEGDPAMNLSWDAKTRVMSSYFKGRGIGDCGGGTDWVWDGAKFRVVGQRMMDECLGAIAWITYFRARPVPVGQR